VSNGGRTSMMGKRVFMSKVQWSIRHLLNLLTSHAIVALGQGSKTIFKVTDMYSTYRREIYRGIRELKVMAVPYIDCIARTDPGLSSPPQRDLPDYDQSTAPSNSKPPRHFPSPYPYMACLAPARPSAAYSFGRQPLP
jgi:hypothetical protein